MSRNIFKHRIRIENTEDTALNGGKVTVTNTVTGETVSHIKCMDVHIEPSECIVAHITYYDHNEDGSLVVVDHKPVEHDETVEVAECALIALEALTPLEKEVYSAMQDAYSLNMRHREVGALDRIADNLVHAIQNLYREKA